MDRPLVGVGVFVWTKEGKIVLLKRKGSHGAGEWSLPGGHLEGGEDFEACCKREVKEETGLEISHIQQFAFTNDIFEKENKHYVTLFFMSRLESGELTNTEPDKCEELGWFEMENLPSPLFKPLENLTTKMLEAHAQRMAHAQSCGGGCGKKDAEGNCEGCSE